MSDEKDLMWFSSTSHADASYQVSSQLAFRFRRGSVEYISKLAAMAAILDFSSEQFFLYSNHSDASYQVFRISSPFGSGDEAKNKNFKMSTILAFQSEWFSCFDLLVTSMLPVKFQDYLTFVSGREAKNRFSRWRPWRLSWISHQNNFSIFIYKSPRCFLPSFKSIGFLFKEKKRKKSKWRPWRPSWLANRYNFKYLCSTRHPDASYQVSSQLPSGEEAN